MSAWPINPFDAAVYLCLAVAIVAGFRSGLLRSMATIFGYLAAMPIAVATTPRISGLFGGRLKLPESQTWIVLVAIFLVVGFLLGMALRTAVSELAGPEASLPDRAAGAAFGAVRVVLLAVLLVLVFERIIPSGREPAFLATSRLRPVLTMAGQQGLKALPEEMVEYIDTLKRQRRIGN